MRKCDICGSQAISELIIKGEDGTSTNDICERCSQLLANALVNVANMRMREKFGENALLISKNSRATGRKRGINESRIDRC